ncbi:DNA-binding transcriptional activator FeaR [Nocardioides dokdonensis FR1436]|uniref:DNA-binding transcriptional activator FeaR n=1 Tax=Nocardioides dokdonensis FR1436 TaxID=1300347 RepID=A0A1A9GEG7_9ACTN|nr:AraC family transcriptional regulator [Nocardioides dokdonensis]ANH36667.1 DNA-binding transcriptional activator FeaR [Nocardioides dokdonensis FR1436]
MLLRCDRSHTRSGRSHRFAPKEDGCTHGLTGARRDGGLPPRGTDTGTFSPTERAAAWRDHVTDNHGRLSLDFGSPTAFNGGTQVQRCGALQLVDFWSDAICYLRLEKDVDHDGDDSLRVIVPTSGTVRIVAAGVRHDLSPGLAGAVSMERGFRLEQDAHAHALVLSLPRAWWRTEPIDRPAVWDLARGPGAVFVAMLRQIAAERADLDADSFRRACEAAALVLPRGAQVDLTAQALALIREHSDSPDFGPAELACMLGWSLRSLQKAMRLAGHAPAEMIRTQRLERAASRLGDPGWRASTVGHVAHASGFGSLTAFNTAFRSHLGCSPTQFRATVG